jgi:hypothetical protein
MSAKSFDRRLLAKIVTALSLPYLAIFLIVGTSVPNYDPFSPVFLVGELIFGGIFLTVGVLLYIFGSKKSTWKMMKSRSIGRYGRVLYLIITTIILVAYGMIMYGFVNAYLTAAQEKDKQNLLTGLALVGVLVGAMIFVYLRHVFMASKGIPSRYKRHPPVFYPSSNDIPK